MKKILLGVLFMGALLFAMPAPVHAESLRIQPLQYRTELKKGEKKKGFVDITNPSNAEVTLKLYVNAFSQTDNQGNLTFFPNEQIAAGIQLDYESVVLGPRQTLRLFFIIDGSKLPSGDVFAVIFAETQPVEHPGANTSVRVGTLAMITNGTPGPRDVAITGSQIPFFQVGDAISGSLTMKNPAPKDSATGFFPAVSVAIQPWGGSAEYTGPLLFAGRERTADFRIPSNLFGFYEIKVKANRAEESTVVFLITGWWRMVVPVGLGLLAIGFIIIRHKIIRRLP